MTSLRTSWLIGQILDCIIGVDDAELRQGKGPAGLAPFFDLTLERPSRHFRHEAGERQDGTGLRHAVAGVGVEPKLQRFSGKRLRQSRTANENLPARKIDALCLGTVQQHPQDGWHECERVTFSR